MYRMEGRAQIHCDTEARSNMSNYLLAAQCHQCCYLTRNSPAFSVAQRLGENMLISMPYRNNTSSQCEKKLVALYIQCFSALQSPVFPPEEGQVFNFISHCTKGHQLSRLNSAPQNTKLGMMESTLYHISTPRQF